MFHELAVTHVFNCIILLVALFCLEYFLNGVSLFLNARVRENEDAVLPAWAFRAVGYTLFFYVSMLWTRPSLDTPDNLVVAFILLSAGMLLRIASGLDDWQHFALLGVLIGAGYLAKAVMFPLAFCFLAVSPFSARNLRRGFVLSLMATLLFLLVSAPLLIALSGDKGRFTFGDSGRIAYAEFVDGVPLYTHWQGLPPGTGIPKHPTREVVHTPQVFEFATPVLGTYPPWYDPSYWYDGVHPTFHLVAQIAAIRYGADKYFDLFSKLGCLFGGIVAFVLLQINPIHFFREFQKTYLLWIPAVAGLGMYSLIHVEDRFLGGFVLLLWAASFISVRIRVPHHPVTQAITWSIVLVLGTQIAWSAGHAVVRLASLHPSADVEVAKRLRDAEIKPGDKVAFVGSALVDHYWAHLARVSVAAEVSNASQYWSAAPEQKSNAISQLIQSGARAIVARDVPTEFLGVGWKQVSNTSYYILILTR